MRVERDGRYEAGHAGWAFGTTKRTPYKHTTMQTSTCTSIVQRKRRSSNPHSN